MGECHGCETLRRLSLELSIKSRGEVMQFKEKFMLTSVGKNIRGVDVVRHVEPQASQYNQIVAGSSFANARSLQLPDADLVLVVMRLLPDEAQAYVQLHGSYGTCSELKDAVEHYDQRLMLWKEVIITAKSNRDKT